MTGIFHRIIGIAPAIVLFVAAFLKSIDVERSSHFGMLDDRFSSIALANVTIFFELALASWLIAGYGLRMARIVCLIAFTVFFLFSATRLAFGHQDCGCFGEIPVHPSVTIMIDTFMIGLMLVWSPDSGRPSRQLFYLRYMIIGFLTIVILNNVRLTHPYGLQAESNADTARRVVMLKPSPWKGKMFPLGSIIDKTLGLDSDNIDVVLINGDCNACKDLMTAISFRRFGFLTVVMDVSRGETSFFVQAQQYGWVYLPTETTWLIEEPTFLSIRDGIVSCVKSVPIRVTGQNLLAVREIEFGDE